MATNYASKINIDGTTINLKGLPTGIVSEVRWSGTQSCDVGAGNFSFSMSKTGYTPLIASVEESGYSGLVIRGCKISGTNCTIYYENLHTSSLYTNMGVRVLYLKNE